MKNTSIISSSNYSRSVSSYSVKYYISGVLPELGVGDIRKTTYTAWALNLLQDEYQLIDSGEELQACYI